MKIIHNGCSFEIVRYYENKAVIKISPLDGTFTSGQEPIYQTENINNLTTNLGGGFEEWVKDNF